MPEEITPAPDRSTVPDLDRLSAPGNTEFNSGRDPIPGTDLGGNSSLEVESTEGKSAETDGSQLDAPSSSDFSVEQARALLEKKYGKLELGDDVNADNFMDRLVQSKAPKTQRSGEMAMIEQALQSGMTLDQYMAQRSYPDRMLQLDNKSLVKASLTAQYGKSEADPDGLDEAGIDELVNAREARGELTIAALDLRKQFRALKAQKEAEYAKGAPAPVDFQSPAFQQEFANDLKSGVSSIVKEGNGKVFGIDLSKAEDVSKFESIANDWLYPDKQSGVNKMTKFLQSENNVIRVAFVLHALENGHIPGLINDAKEVGKRSVLDKLSKKPASGVGASSGNGDNGPNLDRLAAPAMTL